MSEMEALSQCTKILDDLFTDDSDSVTGVIVYIWERHRRNLDKRVRNLQDQKEKRLADIEVYKKVREAEILGFVKQGKDGNFFIDTEELALKLKEKK